MAPRILVCCVLGLALASCGEDEQEAAAPGGEPVAQLVVTVDPDGRGPEPAKETRLSCGTPRESAVCAEASALEPSDVEPVDPETACTQLFGGAETARLRGRVRGRAVDARFSRSNGCEIERWDNVAALLKAAG
jgi:hypothetical protein